MDHLRDAMVLVQSYRKTLGTEDDAPCPSDPVVAAMYFVVINLPMQVKLQQWHYSTSRSTTNFFIVAAPVL